jgi:molybdopterin biosynthesis enzyme MoaB
MQVSDRAWRGVYEDVSGPLIVEVVKEYLATHCDYMCQVS